MSEQISTYSQGPQGKHHETYSGCLEKEKLMQLHLAADKL